MIYSHAGFWHQIRIKMMPLTLTLSHGGAREIEI